MSGARMRHRQVAQATGMVMAMLNLSSAAALAQIRAYAFASGRSLLDVAADIVNRHLATDDIAHHRPR
jgi:AmiR/NasT family two-component response regulator